MTAEIALKVGKAAGKRFAGRGNFRHRVVIGKDTRLSGYMIEPALTAGFISVGMDVILVGPLPTPAIAMLTRSLRADLGVMISASHNAFEDNGIKLFGPDGYKLSDKVELQIEAAIEKSEDIELAAPAKLGRATRLEDARGRYIEFAKSSFPKNQLLKGLRSWSIAPMVQPTRSPQPFCGNWKLRLFPWVLPPTALTSMRDAAPPRLKPCAHAS